MNISYHDILDLLIGKQKVMGVEVQPDRVNIVGLEKTKGRIRNWFHDSIKIDNCSCVGYHDILNLAISKYPQLRTTETVLVLPHLSVLFKKLLSKNERSSSFSFHGNFSIKDFSVFHDNSIANNPEPLSAIVKSNEVQNFIDLISELDLPVIALIKGIPEWCVSYFVLCPERCNDKVNLAFLENERLTIAEFRRGLCSDIRVINLNHITRPGSIISLNDSKERLVIDCDWIINRANGRLKELEKSGQLINHIKDWHPPTDLPWLTSDYAVAAGAALCNYFPGFTSFNFITDSCRNQVVSKRKLKTIVRITLIMTLCSLCLTLLSSLLFIISGINKNSWYEKRELVEKKIQIIETLKAERTALLSKQNEIGTVYAHRSAFGRLLFEISQEIPDDVWLNKISYGFDNQTSLNASMIGKSKILYIEGFASDNLKIIDFSEKMKSNPNFADISIQLLEQVSGIVNPTFELNQSTKLTRFVLGVKLKC